MQTYFRLLKYLKPHLGILFAAFVTMLGSSLLNNLSIGAIIPIVSIIFGKQQILLGANPPAFVKHIIEYINQIPRDQFLKVTVLLIVVISIFRALTMFFQSYLMSLVSYKSVRDIRNDLYRKMIELPMGFFARSHTGDLVSKVTYDTTVVRDCIAEGVTDIVLQSSEIMGALVMLGVLMWSFDIPFEMIAVMAILIPLIMFPVARIGRRLKKISKENQEAMSDLNTTLYESVQGIHIVKGFGMEHYERTQFEHINQRFFKLIMKTEKRIAFVSPFTEFSGALCAACVIAIGGQKVLGGKLDPGVLVGFLGYLFSIVKPFKRLTRVHLVNQRALAAARRIFGIMDEDRVIENIPNAIILKEFHKNITLQDIEFTYPGQQEPVLKGVHLSVDKGQIVALVGPSGGGKTTLINIIPRFYDPQKGAIFIDGQDIRMLDIASLREKIGIVSQDTFLFHDTVFNNIAYGQEKIAHTLVEHAARLANAHDFIMEMPQQYNTIIGERGAKISGGQKQRLAIARALLKNPPLLILDEATSQLDTQSEQQVQQAIDRLITNRTVLVIAHRLSTIKHANRIVVIEHGRIVQEGTHDQLYAQQGLYRKLYDMQFVD